MVADGWWLAAVLGYSYWLSLKLIVVVATSLDITPNTTPNLWNKLPGSSFRNEACVGLVCCCGWGESKTLRKGRTKRGRGTDTLGVLLDPGATGRTVEELS